VARALIVGCGCRGRLLGERLIEAGWEVRGTSRYDEKLAPLFEAGVDPVLADPDRPGTLLDLVGDVTVVHYLLGSAVGAPELLEAIHGSRLERLMEKLVDTPVRGFVYEAAGSVNAALLASGAEIVRSAGMTWRIPYEIVRADPSDAGSWAAEMKDAALRAISPAGESK
jgi:uncharacterized protein YbjT (DUF2867 family)